MSVIRRLPPLLVNQIAAGEVVERPASVVKELTENSIDAGATRITITIEQGGCELIQITDDGCGMSAEDLPLAIAAHATSKIETASDLDAIGTLGFRGEALASIMSVSRMSITSRRREDDSAMKIDAEGETVSTPAPAGAPPGTTIVVRNLFFNTPARRKFLRTPQTEYNHISELVQKLAMSHPGIGFVFTHNGRITLDVPPKQTPRDRILAVLGRELADEFFEVNTDGAGRERDLNLWGLIGTPAVARGTAKYQHVFLNGRNIREKTVQHAIKEAYRGLIDHSRFPMVVLYIEMDPSQVDVNVHPAKTEVRFRNSQSIHGLVLSTLRERLLAEDLTPKVEVRSPAAGIRFGSGLAPAPTVSGGGGGGTSAFVDYFQQAAPPQPGLNYREAQSAMADAPSPLSPGAPHHAIPGDDPTTTLPTETNSAHHPRILQVHNSYIVLEDEEGVAIIDQHALHERVMFEDLKQRVLGDRNLESQRLLMPAMVDAPDATMMDRLASLQPLFSRIGIDAQAAGPHAIAIHGFPSFLFERHVEPEEFLRELLDQAAKDEWTPNDEAALHQVLDMMSCKAAVKAGDRLNESEICALLRRGEEIERSSNCPHGRPTTIRLSLRELERQFGRR